MNTKDIQELFFSSITHPQGVDAAIAKSDLISPEEWIREQGMDPAKRIEIYANAFFARLLEVASELYPKMVLHLGEDNFNSLWATFYHLHPPEGHNLRAAGSGIAEFISETFPERIFLRDLAILETTCIEIFDALTDPPLTMDDVGQIAPEDWETIIFLGNHNWALLETGFDFEVLNEDSWDGDELEKSDEEEIGVLAYRPEYEVKVMSLNPEQNIFFSGLNQDRSFVEICADIQEYNDCETEEAATKAAACLQFAIENNLIRRN